MTPKTLKNLRDNLYSKIAEGESISYFIPSLWLGYSFKEPLKKIKVNPCQFFVQKIDEILNFALTPYEENYLKGEEWSRKARVYNLFVRHTTAFDHNQKGHLEIACPSSGFRDTGTFLKAIALLPYIKSLGVNTLHLLPITAIGEDGRKGNLGSPYAIRNPFKLDENLSEPFLGMSVEDEFSSLVEAAHLLGMKVVVEFVFRTASKDSDWVKEHPDWFYWIRESVEDRAEGSQDQSKYGSPIFSRQDLNQILEKVNQVDFNRLPAPSLAYRNFFTQAPSPDRIGKENGRWIGMLEDGTWVKIPGAFADWPPDDPQPPWGDVTYLKLFSHPDFNYIAYNTVRMYDSELNQKPNRNSSLWDQLRAIIPYYQKMFKIDGVMIDMGHALPHSLLKKMREDAHQIDPDFAFWEENFHLSYESKKQGYNASIGYIWADQRHPYKLKDLLYRFERETFPLPFFGTSESHNTPRSSTRSGGIVYSSYSWAINNFLPVIPFIHSGFELGERMPVNTGLDFTKEEIEKIPSERLPLFNDAELNWLNPNQLCEWIVKIAEIRKKYEDLILDYHHQTLRVIPCDIWDIFAFERKSSDRDILIVANSNMGKDFFIHLHLHTQRKNVKDLIRGDSFSLADHSLSLHLKPGEVKIFRLK